MRRFLLASLVLAFALTRWAVPVQAADPDTTPPTLVSAVYYGTNDNVAPYFVWVSFSEKMDSNSVFTVTNYRLKSVTGGLTANVIDVDYQPGAKTTQNVLLTVDNGIDITKDWIITAFRIADTNGNVTATNSMMITMVDPVISQDQEYDYLDRGYYFDNQQMFDQAWIASNYDSTWWGLRKSVFYLGASQRPAPNASVPPTGASTTLCCYLPGDIEQPSTTSYYRTTFQVQGSLFNSVFQMRALIADGAVFYLNGKEVFRTNIAASVLVPTYKTLANRAGSLDWAVNYVTLPLNAQVQPGLNTLAVEVHNDSVSDPMVGWGLELVQRFTNHIGGPLAIIQHPKDATNAVEGTVSQFEVKPDGKPPYKYAWQLISAAGVTNPIAGGTNRILNLDVLLTHNNAKVFCKVTGGNPSSTLSSSNALIKVTADTNAPALLSALYDTDADGILVNFSEGMKLSLATNVANYTITNHLGVKITILSAEAIDKDTILLTTAKAPSLEERWTLVTTNLTDNAGTPNKLNSAVSAVVGGAFPVVPMISDWHYYQNGTNAPVGTNWMRSDYKEITGWNVGTALFYVEDADLPAAKNTALDLTPNGIRTITYYFRKTFVFGGSTNGVSLLVNHIVDDGMVVWLNGTPVFRFNIAGTPAYGAFATEVGDAVLVSNGKLLGGALTNLVQGTNLLAVEVHQSSLTSSDIVFGMQLDSSVASLLQTNAAIKQLPTITIDAPANNSGAVQGTSVTINATAAGQGGATITKVEFFDGAASLGVDSSAPYSGVLATTGATALGDHNIRAVATDSNGSTKEAAIIVKVTTPPAPKLSVKLSADGKNAIISWTPAQTPGFVLKSTPAIAPTKWTAVQGAANGMSVPVAAAKSLYYRLELQ